MTKLSSFDGQQTPGTPGKYLRCKRDGTAPPSFIDLYSTRSSAPQPGLARFEPQVEFWQLN